MAEDSEEKKKGDHEIPEELSEQLQDFKKVLWRAKILEAFLAGLVGLIVSFLLVFILDRIVATPGLVRLALLIIGASVFAIFAPYWVNRWVYKNRQENQLARLISGKFPRLGDRLLGVLELSEQDEAKTALSPQLRDAATRDVAKAAAKRNLRDALPSNLNSYGLITLAGLALLVALTFSFLPKAGLNALKRWLNPLSDTPRYTLTQFDGNLPERIIVPKNEPFDFTVGLSKDSEHQPIEARARLKKEDWKTSRQENGSYQFSFAGQLEKNSLQIAAGDARAKIEVIPTLPPSLQSVEVTLQYPPYLERPETILNVKAGTLALLSDSQVQLHANASRDLSSGQMHINDVPMVETAPAESEEAIEETPVPQPQTLTASAEGSRANYPTFTMPNMVRNLRLNWKDTLGLEGNETFRLRLEPLTDEPPTIYAQGTKRQLAILAEETVEFEVVAQDDFGLKVMGLEWRGEHTRPSAEAPSQGELELTKGGPLEVSLSSEVAFSPDIHDIGPQKLFLRAYTEDYLAERGRSYSQPIEIYILTREEHSQMLKDRFDRAIAELEETARQEQENQDETKRLEKLDDEQLQAPDTQKRMQELADAESENTEKMKELAESMEELFEDALRNGDIESETMKKLSETSKNMRELADLDLPEVEKELQEAQDQSSTPEQRRQELAEAAQEQQEAIEKMKETMEKANEANRDFEAATFVNRLKKAAGEQDGIATAMIAAMAGLVGESIAELDPTETRVLGELNLQQKRTTSDLQWLEEDLRHFYTRTEKSEHLELLNVMEEARVAEGLDINSNRLRNNHTFVGIVRSKEWAERLRNWAKILEDAQNAAGGCLLYTSPSPRDRG